MFPIGGQRVGIVTDVAVLDGGQPVVSEFMEPQTTPVTVWVDGCLFEIQTDVMRPALLEQQGETVTTKEFAWAFMPVVNGNVPAVDSGGSPTPIAASAITSSMSLRHNGRTYVMRGDAVLERDIRGRENHVFCVCEHQEG